MNVKVTLTDPFVGMSEEAIATGTDSGSSGGGCNPQENISVERFVYSTTWWACGEQHPPGIYFEKHIVKDCWAGGTSQYCEKGDYTSISNIVGQIVCEVGGFMPASCT